MTCAVLTREDSAAGKFKCPQGGWAAPGTERGLTTAGQSSGLGAACYTTRRCLAAPSLWRLLYLRD